MNNSQLISRLIAKHEIDSTWKYPNEQYRVPVILYTVAFGTHSEGQLTPKRPHVAYGRQQKINARGKKIKE